MMLKLLKKIFGKADHKVVLSPAINPVAPAAVSQRAEAPHGVEVASLSLCAILDRFPEDLKTTISRMPDADTKVVLPVNAIMKQLPSGNVKMSLASLHRQAPGGTFQKTNFEEKRMIEVPLAEIFKSINPARLQRRNDQRQYEVPDDVSGLFGQNGASRSLSQSTVAEPAHAPVAAPSPAAIPSSAKAPVALKMPGIAPIAPLPEDEVPVAPAPVPAPLRMAAAPAPALTIAKAPAESALKLDGALTLPLAQVAAGWEESIRDQLSVLPGDTTVTLPVIEVGAGLQKGKVVFTWAQVCHWLKPAPTSSMAIEDSTPLLFPLKVIAPAFIAVTGAKKRQSSQTVSNEELPDFFGPAAGRVPARTPVANATAPAPIAPVEAVTPLAFVETEAEPQPESVALPLPIIEAPLLRIPPAVALPPTSEPQNIGELFVQSEKTDWTPSELIKATCSLPGVAGAVIALEEGLVVAQQLPEGLTSETVAAFMPQIFSRIDRYTGEMQLGDTSEVCLLTTQGPCHFFRLGKVFFATLGRSGENLPSGLRLVADEISRQNS